ncbi:unnamed protein product [Oppiella nova]|uniref:SCP domain-containing protein n=1 Tax=Oppiella nova TaxID=334625 RepID=A0A7R9QQ49_9ACAR|nr:unnamed protein product [Oppiella nova]CAG2170232.1 unnamed protein product [Oppiella nova]
MNNSKTTYLVIGAVVVIIVIALAVGAVLYKNGLSKDTSGQSSTNASHVTITTSQSISSHLTPELTTENNENTVTSELIPTSPIDAIKETVSTLKGTVSMVSKNDFTTLSPVEPKTTPLFESFDADCLKNHNRLRARHVNTPPLKLNYTLADSANAWNQNLSQRLEFRHSFEHGVGSRYGENLWSSNGTESGYKTLTCKQVVIYWYREIWYYDYDTAGLGSTPQNFTKVGHFTQLVWNTTTDVGCAKFFNKTTSRIYLACHYYPAGNLAWGFGSYVKPLIDNSSLGLSKDTPEQSSTNASHVSNTSSQLIRSDLTPQLTSDYKDSKYNDLKTISLVDPKPTPQFETRPVSMESKNDFTALFTVETKTTGGAVLYKNGLSKDTSGQSSTNASHVTITTNATKETVSTLKGTVSMESKNYFTTLSPVEPKTTPLFESFNTECLESHNKFRAMHLDTPPLKLNYKLVESADSWAKNLSGLNIWRHSHLKGVGENLWHMWASSNRPGYIIQVYNELNCHEAINAFHSETQFYNYKPPKTGHPHNFQAIGHLTQLIWRATTDVGCAKAMNTTNSKVYVVCHYQPPGNYGGQYAANVKSVSIVSIAPTGDDVCSPATCKAPKCSCFSSEPPFGHKKEEIPQFVIMSFDEAVRLETQQFYETLLNYTNPNDCPIEATFFVSHVDTNYKLVHELHRRGHEIAAHSISKTTLGGQARWKSLDLEGWREEFGGIKRILSKLADIPINEIVGSRAPDLQTAGNITFTALADEGFRYDSSQPSRKYTAKPLFPYTLDFGFKADCQIEPCMSSEHTYPGFWSIPMNDWTTKLVNPDNTTIDIPCAEVDACTIYDSNGTYIEDPTVEQFVEVFEENFNRFYTANRAPFPLFLRDAWLSHTENRRTALLQFIDSLTAKKDVYFVSISELIDWMGRGSEATLLKNYKQTSCVKHPIEDKCGKTDLVVPKGNCQYKHIDVLKGLDKLVVICNDVQCPHDYPWLHDEYNQTVTL